MASRRCRCSLERNDVLVLPFPDLTLQFLMSTTYTSELSMSLFLVTLLFSAYCVVLWFISLCKMKMNGKLNDLAEFYYCKLLLTHVNC